MGTILFECPITGRSVSTGIETQPVSFCRLSKTWLDLYCPLCGRFHGAKIWLQETSALIGFSNSAAMVSRTRPWHLTPQNDQLMSEYRILCFKPPLRLEWRGQDGQDEAEQCKHRALTLGDSFS